MKAKKYRNAEVESYIKGTLKQLKYLRSRWLNCPLRKGKKANKTTKDP